jgi:hypothetical protein
MGVASAGTHLASSLKDLQKLGVDTVHLETGVTSMSLDLGDGPLAAIQSVGGSPVHALPVFGDTNFDGLLSAKEDAALDVTLNLGNNSIDNIANIAQSLSEAGIDHVGLDSANLSSNLDYLHALNWIENGLDLTLKIDALGSTPATNPIQDVYQTLKMVDGGVDFLSNSNLSPNETWGDLIKTLHDSGLGHVDIESGSSVHIKDDLASALYESGMLSAMPDANVEIDANGVKLLNSSLKAMSALGVDQVHTDQQQVFVGLGQHNVTDVKDLVNILSSFTDKPLFADTASDAHTGLLVDKTTADTIFNEANASEILSTLQKLGFTEVDVVSGTGNKVDVASHNLVAQTPVTHIDVQVLGMDANDLLHAVDPDILHKPIK